MYELSAGRRTGTVKIPASKSMAHRYLICAALSGCGADTAGNEKRIKIVCDGMSVDIEATINCLNALGASIAQGEELDCAPVCGNPQENCELDCGESGSTLRFLLPVVGALGAKGHFKMHGRLPERPLAPLDGELKKHGMTLKKQGDELLFEGRLSAGSYQIPGTVSSQYISGLLFALPMLKGDSILTVTGPVESRDYILMTEEALAKAGIILEKTGNTYRIPGGQHYDMPEKLVVEGDFSNAAFFLSIGALSPEGTSVTGLNTASLQGDRRIVEILEAFGAKATVDKDTVSVRGGELSGITIDAKLIPDLVPVLSVVAAGAEGITNIVNAGRLRLKESDRLKTTAALINALGGSCRELEDGLVITGSKGLKGGIADTCNDHRIAMAAAVAACISEDTVKLTDEKCVAKSYPGFFEDFLRLEVCRNYE